MAKRICVVVYWGGFVLLVVWIFTGIDGFGFAGLALMWGVLNLTLIAWAAPARKEL